MPPIGEKVFWSESPPLTPEQEQAMRVVRAKRVVAYTLMQAMVPDTKQKLSTPQVLATNYANYQEEHLQPGQRMLARLERLEGSDEVWLRCLKIDTVEDASTFVSRSPARVIAKHGDITYTNKYIPILSATYFERTLSIGQQQEAIQNTLETLNFIADANGHEQGYVEKAVEQAVAALSEI